MKKFRLSPNGCFKQKYQKLIRKDQILKARIIKIFELLQVNPFFPSLKTHKVDSKVQNRVFSSSITSDLRIIWEFNGTKLNVIDLLDIGGHSGSKGV